MRILIALLALTAGIAGCTNAPAEPDTELHESPSGTATAIPAEPEEGAVVLQPIPSEMHWTDCQGIFSTFNWPGPTNPAADFGPWPEREASDMTDVRMIAMECQRFGYGAIERGPTSFLIEATNERQPPQPCLDLEPSHMIWTVLGMWATDPDIHAALASEGIPAGEATISILADETPGMAHGRADWAIAGSASYLEAFQEGVSDVAGLGEFPMRFFWANSIGGVSAVDFGYEAKGPSYPSERLVAGNLASPMTMAALGGPYIGQGMRFTDGTFGGKIQRFENPACEPS